MNLKKFMASAGAMVLLGSGFALANVATAAAEVTLNIQANTRYIVAGETLAISVSPECEAAEGAVRILVDGSDVTADVDAGQTYDYVIPDSATGTDLIVQAHCVQDDDIIGVSNELDISVFGVLYITPEPNPFNTGEPVLVTAGDFVPGAAVELTIATQQGQEVFTVGLGTAREDFSASATVTFPADIEPGEYVVTVTDGQYTAEAFLTIGEQPEPSPTPDPTETETATQEPSPTETPSGDEDDQTTPSPTSRPTSSAPGNQPGLPATGL